jgi:MFS family permease
MPHHRRAHVRIATSLFAGLGLQIGLWAVLVPELVASRSLSPGELGVLLGVLAGTSILSLSLAGTVIDRVGRRRIACAGAAGMGAALLLLALLEARWALVPAIVLYGLANGLLDLSANTIGADVEREHRIRVMIRLHAGFSGAAALAALATGAALAAGVSAGALYATGALALLALTVVAATARLPAHAGDGAPVGVAIGDEREIPPAAGAPAAPGRRPCGPLLRAPGVLVALALITLCFFGDGAIEGYVALYLRDLLGAGALLTGVGLALFHGASLVGRLASSAGLDRLGERNLITLAGAGAAAGMLVIVLARSAPLAAAGLLLVGISLSPVVPTALSVAGRADPARAGAAVSLVTAVGYGAFVLGPPFTGALADATSLRTALVPVIVSTALLALTARRL